MKLIRYFWERPDTNREGIIHNGIFSQECEDNDVDNIISTRYKMCQEENNGRIIKSIKIYDLSEER